MPSNGSIDFRQTKEYGLRGWNAYLQTRLLNTKQCVTQDNSTYSLIVNQTGYTYFTLDQVFDDDTQTIASTDVSRASYDTWGRRLTLNTYSKGMSVAPQDGELYQTSSHKVNLNNEIPTRQLIQSPLEADVEQNDPENYYRYLYAYLKVSHQSMKPFIRNEVVEKIMDEVDIPFLNERNEIETMKNFDESIAFTAHVAEDDACGNLDTLGFFNTDENRIRFMKNQISLMETLRVTLLENAAIVTEIDNKYGKKKGLFAYGYRNKEMYEQWQALREFPIAREGDTYTIVTKQPD